MFIEKDFDDDEVMNYFEMKDKFQQGSLKYIAGFAAYEIRNKYKLGIPTKILDNNKRPDWLLMMSRGSNIHPKDFLGEVVPKRSRMF